MFYEFQLNKKTYKTVATFKISGTALQFNNLLKLGNYYGYK